MTPSDRYTLLIARLTTRRVYLSTLVPRPDYKQRAELSNLNTRLETLKTNARKLQDATDDAVLYEGIQDALLLARARNIIRQLEALAPDMSELNGDVA